MNERIKEIAEQASEYVNTVYTPPVRSKTPGKMWEDGHVGWHTQFNQKFAELIVQECLNVIAVGSFLHGQSREAIFATECSDAIKRHFGVEE